VNAGQGRIPGRGMAQHRSIYSSDGTSSSEDDETRPPSPPDQEEQVGDETEGETEGETDEDGSSTPGSDDADGDDHRPATEEADMKRHVAELVVARCPRSARRSPAARASDALAPLPPPSAPLLYRLRARTPGWSKQRRTKPAEPSSRSWSASESSSGLQLRMNGRSTGSRSSESGNSRNRN
jgi:hypothetical protein